MKRKLRVLGKIIVVIGVINEFYRLLYEKITTDIIAPDNVVWITIIIYILTHMKYDDE